MRLRGPRTFDGGFALGFATCVVLIPVAVFVDVSDGLLSGKLPWGKALFAVGTGFAAGVTAGVFAGVFVGANAWVSGHSRYPALLVSNLGICGTLALYALKSANPFSPWSLFFLPFFLGWGLLLTHIVGVLSLLGVVAYERLRGRDTPDPEG